MKTTGFSYGNAGTFQLALGLSAQPPLFPADFQTCGCEQALFFCKQTKYLLVLGYLLSYCQVICLTAGFGLKYVQSHCEAAYHSSWHLEIKNIQYDKPGELCSYLIVFQCTRPTTTIIWAFGRQAINFSSCCIIRKCLWGSKTPWIFSLMNTFWNFIPVTAKHFPRASRYMSLWCFFFPHWVILPSQCTFGNNRNVNIK